MEFSNRVLQRCDHGYSLRPDDIRSALLCGIHQRHNLDVDFDNRPKFRPQKPTTGNATGALDIKSCDCFLSRILVCSNCRARIMDWKTYQELAMVEEGSMLCALARFPGKCQRGRSCSCQGRGVGCPQSNIRQFKKKDKFESKWLGRSSGFNVVMARGDKKLKRLLGDDFRPTSSSHALQISSELDVPQVSKAVIVRRKTTNSHGQSENLRTRIIDIKPPYRYWGCSGKVETSRLKQDGTQEWHASTFRWCSLCDKRINLAQPKSIFLYFG
ncbi:hypothetical protein AOL_s00091g7 [Orbilia oligospora ATCC 24927]|uniref:Uncharacterized protein n=1 Tax=Arthrobotrys oligospora (strain ATCC 24927 / CBS 115.81 / DSM 1491) TaxID=756982 RepID=G1XHV5_ARTOA|nr:hypothetical protein AOL_s00091g7 [Orbilia oligospora ATCC 24927]EGX47263.1 hypothetical protein AOL_s00091g7 [Orbilia oligospora ATCC 24927]